MTRSSVVALVACGCLLIAAPAAEGYGRPTPFDAVAAEQTFTVPAGTTWVHVHAVGSSGAHGGGPGAVVDTDLPVVPGETLYVEVGDTAGFNGGGLGLFGGGAGGGASDVRTVGLAGDPAASLASRLVVAGGGGGGSLQNTGGSGGFVPGAGGGPFAGQPGSALAGGAPGTGAGAGALGQGGAAVDEGGGGGGGYYGGGGGAGEGISATDSGGGAGSNHVAPAAVNTAITTDAIPESGRVTITTGEATVVADAPVAFGPHAIGTVTAHQLILLDTGLGPFETTTTPSISGPGELNYIFGTPNCLGWVVTCHVPVLFSPTTTGPSTATLTVPTSDEAGPLEVPLSGTGVAATGGGGDAGTGGDTDTDTGTGTPTRITYVTQVAAPAAGPTAAPATPATPSTTTAAKMVLATCHAGRSQGKPVLRCRVVGVPAGATLPSKARLTATLSNRSTRYATGTARTAKGITQLLLTPARRIAAGRYSTLTLAAPGQRTVRTAVVMG
jgi:hypothetical protein